MLNQNWTGRLCAAGLLACSGGVIGVAAQTVVLDAGASSAGFTVNAFGHNRCEQPNGPCAPGAQGVNSSGFVPGTGFAPGIAPGWDAGALASVTARDCGPQLPVSGLGTAWVVVDESVGGFNTTELRFLAHAKGEANILDCFEAYTGWGEVENYEFTAEFSVPGPPNQPVRVLVEYDFFSQIQTEHEAGDEDPVNANRATLDIGPISLTNASLANPPSLAPSPGIDSTGQTTGGTAVFFDTFTNTPFQVALSIPPGDQLPVRAEVNDPGPPDDPFRADDRATASVYGKVILRARVEGDEPPTTPRPGDGRIEFSLDIGSAQEMSTAVGSSDTLFDPGDMYVTCRDLPPGPQDGYRDDRLFAGVNTGFIPFPEPSDPFGPVAPVCRGDEPQVEEFFDLDGFDAIGVDLIEFQQNFGSDGLRIPRSLLLGMAGFNEDLPVGELCIYEPDNVFLTWDDDSAPDYAIGGFDTFCSIPAADTSTFGETFGTIDKRDEVVGFVYAPAFAGPAYATEIVRYPVGAEDELHPDLARNPGEAFDEQRADDDMDALDVRDRDREPELPETDPNDPGDGTVFVDDNGNVIVVPGEPIVPENDPCPNWYFSGDHEALLDLADPALIWRYNLASGAVEPVIPPFALGLRNGADVDGFEFAWLRETRQDPIGREPGGSELYLAILFTVDEDDPGTTVDESGGLDPATVYYSFLDGTNAPFSRPGRDDVDGIAVYANQIEEACPDDDCCPGDANDDGVVDATDFFTVIQFFGVGTTCEQGNFDGDAVTDADDFFTVIQFFGLPCPRPGTP